MGYLQLMDEYEKDLLARGYKTSIAGHVSRFEFCQWLEKRAAQQSMHPTSETLRGLLASLTPEQLSALEVLLTPLTCG